ncbi:MAG TPA: flagellar brake protein [archaeon]|nr:flagellar brake protein [archaeon]
MDESFRETLKLFKWPEPGTKGIMIALFIILFIISLLFLLMYLNSLMARRRERKYMLETAEKHNLDREERDLILSILGTKTKIHPSVIFSSLRGFNRFFGPLIHELTDQVRTSPEAHRKIHKIFALRKRLFGEVAYHFGGITTTIQLKTGQKITLDFSHGDQSMAVSSLVLDVDENIIAVVNPSLKGEFIRFDKSHPFKVSFYRENDGYYQFQTYSLQPVEESAPLFLFLAHAEDIQQIPPREFYRITYRLPFKFKLYPWNESLKNRYLSADEKSKAEKEGVIINIGRGEMVFTTEEKLAKDDILVFSLELKSELTIRDLLGKVVTVTEQTETKGKRVHMKFFNPNPSEEELLFS